MVRGRRTRSATNVLTNISQPHHSTLLHKSNSTIISKNTILNDNTQTKIINDDQQCYASPKRKESKIDETLSISIKTRSTTKCKNNITHSTKIIVNGNGTNSHINLNKLKGSHQQNHHQQHNHRQKTITKYFITDNTSKFYKSINSQNKTHPYNGENKYSSNYKGKNKEINENDIEIDLVKTIDSDENGGEDDVDNNDDDDDDDDEEEDDDDEENSSEDSNKTYGLNGTMNCSGLSITSKNNIENANITHNENTLIINDFDILKQANEKINSDNGYFTNSSTSSTSSTSSNGGTNEVLDKANASSSLLKSKIGASKSNLFLQEPVLSLNIDKSPNQPSSIKINKSFEIESVFSAVISNSNCNSICLNGFNKIVTLKGSPKRTVSSDAETIILNNCNIDSSCSNYNNNNNNNKINNDSNSDNYNIDSNNFNNNNSSNTNIGIILSIDNNSNDSGVIIDQNNSISNYYRQYQNSTDCNKNIKQRDELSPSKRRKPTTPHRILCPSPVKLPLVEKCISSSSSSLERTPNNIKTNTATHGVVNGAQKRNPKSRRRLNTPQSENSSIALTQLSSVNNLRDETFKRISKQQQKLILNSAKNPTAQQNSNNNIKNSQSKLLNSHAISPSRQNVLFDTNSMQIQTTLINNDGRVVNNNQMKPPPGRSTQQQQTQQQQKPKTQQTLADDFFPVRRSIRKTKTAVKEEMMRTLEQAILENREDGLKVRDFEGKGRGIITTRKFLRGEFVIEYIGDLINMNEANKREYKYSLDEKAGCYMYYFKHKNQQYCIDATEETGKLGRLVNHSRNGNLITKVVVIKCKPHLVLIARDDIEAGVELTYDYGDRSKEALQHHPWLAL